MYFVSKLLFEDAIYKVSLPVSAYMEACKHSGEPKLTWGSSELIFPKKKINPTFEVSKKLETYMHV